MSSSIELIFKWVDGREISRFAVQDTTTVYQIKVHLSGLVELPPASFQIMCRNLWLMDHQNLSGLPSGTSVFVSGGLGTTLRSGSSSTETTPPASPKAPITYRGGDFDFPRFDVGSEEADSGSRKVGRPTKARSRPTPAHATLSSDTLHSGSSKSQHRRSRSVQNEPKLGSIKSFPVTATPLKLSEEWHLSRPSITAASIVKAFPQYCTAVGISSGQVGEEQSFKVILRSQGGGLLVDGSSQVCVSIEGPEVIESEIVNMKDGNYNVSYLPKKRGLYDLQVLVDGIHIPGSPFQAVFHSASRVTPTSCTARGSGLVSAVAGIPVSFFFEAKDEFGNPMGVSTADWSVNIAGPETIQPQVIPMGGNGAYSISYTAKRSANYEISIKVRSEHVQGSPFTVLVLPGRPSRENTLALGSTLTEGIKSEKNTFYVKTFDQYKNAVLSGGLHFRLDIEAGQWKGSVVDMKNGTYHVNYIIDDIGAYTLSLFQENEHVPGSPFSLRISEAQVLAPKPPTRVSSGLRRASSPATNCLTETIQPSHTLSPAIAAIASPTTNRRGTSAAQQQARSWMSEPTKHEPPQQLTTPIISVSPTNVSKPAPALDKAARLAAMEELFLNCRHEKCSLPAINEGHFKNLNNECKKGLPCVTTLNANKGDARIHRKENYNSSHQSALDSYSSHETEITRVQAYLRSYLAWSIFYNQLMSNKVIDEIITSEKSYLKNLNIVKSVFHEPLQRIAQAKKDLDSAKLSVVFSNFEFVISVTTELCVQLLSMEPGRNTISLLADIFLNSVPNIKFTYETYVTDYSQALKMLSWLEANSPSFRSFLEEQNSEVHGYLTLPALLIAPIQRLPKYELLLLAPPNTTEYNNVQEALEAIKSTAVYVNDRKRDAENITKLAEIRDIAGLPHDLFSNTGNFIAESAFRYRELPGKSSHSVNRHIILLEHVLILSKTKNQAKAKRKYVFHVYLKDAFYDCNGEGFKIVASTSAFMLVPDKPGQRLEWQSYLERLIGKKQRLP